MSDTRVFTLEEANAVLPQIIEITEEAHRRIQEARFPWELIHCKKMDMSSGMTVEAVICQQWAEKVAELGGQPKGFFTVDFQSPYPKTLYCWTYGETEICHEHKVWETFVDRRPLREQ